MQRPARLSAAFVRTLTEPGRYSDGPRAFGLSLLVKPTACGELSKTFSQRLWTGSKPYNIGLGPWPLVTLDEARDTAIDNARAARAGVDLLADRKRKAGVPTFAEAVEKVLAIQSAGWKGGSKTEGIWRSRLAEYAFPVLGRVKVDAITTAHVLDVLAPIWTTRRETARKVRQYVSAVMAWAIVQGHRSDNPAGDVLSAALPKAGAKATHQRALPFADVAGALAKVRASDAGETTKLAIEFLTLTAARSGEVRGATWSEIDMDAATWTIPGSRMKTGREHRVPLATAAVAVLERAREYADGSGLLFPSPTGRMLSDSTLSKLFRELAVAGTPHGMRSSFRDWAAECSDAPREVAELALAHVEGTATERAYRRTDLFERRRELMESWAGYVSR